MPSTVDTNRKGNDAAYMGDEDFIGHKTYQIGDLPSKVDWKASSRGIGMYSKNMLERQVKASFWTGHTPLGIKKPAFLN